MPLTSSCDSPRVLGSVSGGVMHRGTPWIYTIVCFIPLYSQPLQLDGVHSMTGFVSNASSGTRAMSCILVRAPWIARPRTDFGALQPGDRVEEMAAHAPKRLTLRHARCRSRPKMLGLPHHAVLRSGKTVGIFGQVKGQIAPKMSDSAKAPPQTLKTIDSPPNPRHDGHHE